MPKLSAAANQRQEEIETAIGNLGIILTLLENDRLRVCQAVRRFDGSDNLLDPVVLHNDEIVRRIRRVQAALRTVWNNGQTERWGNDR